MKLGEMMLLQVLIKFKPNFPTDPSTVFLHFKKTKDTMMHESPDLLASKFINKGVEFYENGCLEDAIGAFADALAISKHIMRINEEMSASMYDPNGPFQPQFGKCEKVMPPTNGLFLFLNPIKLPTRLPTNKLSKTLSLITMFNLAICYHRSAIVNNMDRPYLRKALQLYELAYAVQMQEAIDMTLTPTMIIMSNVGHIHKILGNENNAMQCFQHLLSTLMFLVEAGEKDMVWEFEGFFDNVLKTVYANSPAAAA
jgi:tetratricopeptide (TPR) repeat protein